jgi:hypothetical protein
MKIVEPVESITFAALYESASRMPIRYEKSEYVALTHFLRPFSARDLRCLRTATRSASGPQLFTLRLDASRSST